MPIADIVITIAIVISVIVGFVRGFIKEAISIVTLLFAIWAALNFGPGVGNLADNWLASEELQVWFGRAVVFVSLLVIGGLIEWGIAKLVRLSVLSGTDRVFGMFFGLCRGVVVIGVLVIAGQFANFDNDPWWRRSQLIPLAEQVADWIRVMAPKGIDMLDPDDIPEQIPIDLGLELSG